MKRVVNIIIASIIMLASCQKAEDVGTPYFEVIAHNDSGEFVLDNSATSLLDGTGLTIFVYSNQSWNVSLTFENETSDWISIYPDHGKDDGRFFINVSQLDSPYPRTCNLNISDSQGNILFTTLVTQKGAAPYLKSNTEFLSFGCDGGNLNVELETNVRWYAEVLPKTPGEDISWCQLIDKGDISQTIKCSKNTSGKKRFATIRFYMEDSLEELYLDIPLTQLPEFKFETAELISVSAVSELTGIIEENYKIQGYVINDLTTENIADKRLVYMQDDSNKGIVLQLQDESANIYSVNDKLTVWLPGAVVERNDLGTVITNVTQNNLSDNTTLLGEAATPVELTDISQISNYPNTLVRLKGVYFANPIGTICNVGTWKEGHCKYALTPILDKTGNMATIRTLASFTQKYDQQLSRKEYDIVAIVMPDKGEMMRIKGDPNNLKRLVGETYTHTLRIRSSKDLHVSDITPVFTPFVYWLGINTSGANWNPAFGNGLFDLCAGIVGKEEPNSKERISYCLSDISQEPSDGSCYKGYSTSSVWDPGYGGYYYELSTSTKSCTGDIYFSFIMGSYGSAARYWKVQYCTDGVTWTDLPNGEFELWNSLSSGSSSKSDYSRLYTMPSLCFKIPNSAGLDNLSIRITTQGQPNERSDGSGTANGDTSSTALYYFAFSQL